MLLTTFFGAQVPPKRLAAILAAHREVVAEQLAHYRDVERQLAGEPYGRATARYGIAYCRMAIQWIDTEGAALAG